MILITGAFGFIGSHIVDILFMRTKYELILLDNMSSPNAVIRPEWERIDRIHLVNSDFCQDKLEEVLQKEWLDKITAICHQGAFTSVPQSVETPIDCFQTNVFGFQNILEFARKYGVKKVVYASSSSVLGDEKGEVVCPYALSKKINEEYAQLYSKIYNIKTIGLRYFNVFGPRQNPTSPYASVIPKFISNIIQKKTIEVYGDGEQTRDYIYVGNVAFANFQALTNDYIPSGIFEIASGETRTVNQVLEALKEILTEYQPIQIKYQKERPGDVRHSSANIRSAREFGLVLPNMDFQFKLKETVSYYLSQ